MEKCSRIFHSYVQIPGIVIAIENSKDRKTIHTSRWTLWGGFPPERSLSRYDDPTLKASPVKGHTYRICINHGRPAVPWNQINMLCGQIGRTMLLHNMFASSTMENPWKKVSLSQKQDRPKSIREFGYSLWTEIILTIHPVLISYVRIIKFGGMTANWASLKSPKCYCSHVNNSDLLKLSPITLSDMFSDPVPGMYTLKYGPLSCSAATSFGFSLGFPNQARRRRSPNFGQQPAAHHVTCPFWDRPKADFHLKTASQLRQRKYKDPPKIWTTISTKNIGKTIIIIIIIIIITLPDPPWAKYSADHLSDVNKATA